MCELACVMQCKKQKKMDSDIQSIIKMLYDFLIGVVKLERISETIHNFRRTMLRCDSFHVQHSLHQKQN